MLSDNLIAPLLLALLLMVPSTGVAASERAEDEIRSAFAAWVKNFNQGKAEEVCALFSPELRYDFRGYPERGFSDICRLLKRSLADRSKQYAYHVDVREVLVDGDLAIARVVRTLAITLPNGQIVTSVEPGMDVLRRGPDGAWKIIRYLAYAVPKRAAPQAP